MSENITHTAVMDDAFNLMLASGRITDAFKAAGKNHRRFGQLAGVTRSGDRFTIDLLERYRESWPAKARKAESETIEARIAFVLGWLCHRGTDREFKPIFRSFDPEGNLSPTDCSVYHDAYLFRELYMNEQEFSKTMFEGDMNGVAAADVVDVPALLELFRVSLKRVLIEMHTFIPDQEDIDGWLDKLQSLQQKFYVDSERYAEAVARPDPDKWRKFIEDINFYDRSESLLVLTKGLRQGNSATLEELDAALKGEPKSHYARAVRKSYQYIESASLFFDGEIDRNGLSERLEIGKPGADGKPV
jgi:hypothetical protein